MNKFQANRIIYENLGIHIDIFDGKKWVQTSIKSFIPMRKYNEKSCEFGEVYDVEVLINKRKNIWFSINCYLGNLSWVKNIRFLKDRDRRLNFEGYKLRDHENTVLNAAKFVKNLKGE